MLCALLVSKNLWNWGQFNPMMREWMMQYLRQAWSFVERSISHGKWKLNKVIGISRRFYLSVITPQKSGFSSDSQNIETKIIERNEVISNKTVNQ